MIFFIIFIMIPFIEIFVFLSVGEEIGILTTLLLAFLTAIIGGALVRFQGLMALQMGRESLMAGRMPVQEIFDGFCLVAAGALLITPGFVTDTVGFALLIPKVRQALREKLGERMQAAGPNAGPDAGSNAGPGGASAHGSGSTPPPRDAVIETEYVVIKEEDMSEDDQKPS